LENGDPQEGVIKVNPNFRPQNYSNVPPPPNLNRGGGRGRANGGRGGPRGNGNRGRGGAHRGRGSTAVAE
jgi:5'-3' exoribonuclease 1